MIDRDDDPSWIDLLAPLRLRAFLNQTLGPGALSIEGRARSGSSNVTAFVRYADRAYVVRRPPAGDLLPTSHDMMREARFLRAFAGTPVPVPAVAAQCEDPSVIGAPFYVMARCEGAVLQQGAPAHLRDPKRLGELCDAAIDVLAAIHAEPWRDRGLPGKPDGYVERQVARWTSQLELTSTASRLAGIEAVTRWVHDHRPVQAETTIVHGDYGLHNVIVGLEAPTIAAVLDWEMATLGDPIADLVWFLQNWGVARKGVGNPANYVTLWPGARSRAEMLDRYQAVSGRSLRDELFYRIFSMWKGMIVTEGLYAAYLAGEAANPDVVRFETEIPRQLTATLALLEREG